MSYSVIDGLVAVFDVSVNKSSR